MADLVELLSELKLNVPKENTGIAYDERMTEYHCLWDSEHHDSPKRFVCALERCETYGLVQRCRRIKSRCAKEDEVKLAHSSKYVEYVHETQSITDEMQLENVSSHFDAIYFHPKSYECALLAAGCTLELVSSIMSRKVNNGLAIVRPPGHHAMVSTPCGYCIFNNVAIAAHHALLHYDLERILIVDWDVHHGQATQQMFYDDPRVLYFSIHRYEFGAFWPNLKESNFHYIGRGPGKGYNINVPLNKIGLGNTEYLAIFHNILLPVAFEFNPQLVLVSAGFDAALGCPEGQMEVSPYAYAHLLNELSCLAEGRVCVVMEGGYFLPSLSESVAVTLRTLLGDPCPVIPETSHVDDSVVDTILNVITALRPIWNSLSIQNTYKPDFEGPADNEKKHFVVTKSVGFEYPPFVASYPTRNACSRLSPRDYEMYERHINDMIRDTDLTVPAQRTCIVYDERMTEHINKKDDCHPEVKERIIVIKEKLESTGLAEKCLLLNAREASNEELALVHSHQHIDTMQSTRQMKKKDMCKLEKNYDSVYLSPETYTAAAIASGSLLQVVDAVITGKCVNGFCIIRPPGHHAEVDEANGFCIFNSVAIGAKYALNKYGDYSTPITKVLIIDWDIHHGNGIQHVYYNDNRVLYISLHRFDDASFFPCAEDASYKACGTGKGAGYNINIPWNSIVGDGDYCAAFFHIILPVAYEFQPDLILVSCGFDAAINDPLGGCNVSPSCYGYMTKLLSGLAKGKLILALEGGYNLSSVSESAYHCVKALLGESCASLPDGLYPSSSAIETIQNVVRSHEKYWRSLRFKMQLPDHGCFTHVSNPFTLKPLVLSEPDKESIQNVVSHDENDVYALSPKLYCVSPLPHCPHLDHMKELPTEQLNPFAVCETCGHTRENWVCLHCYKVFCGRFVNEHMLKHSESVAHFLTLSYSDLSVWCYKCEAYIHNQIFTVAKQQVLSAKFSTSVDH